MPDSSSREDQQQKRPYPDDVNPLPAIKKICSNPTTPNPGSPTSAEDAASIAKPMDVPSKKPTNLTVPGRSTSATLEELQAENKLLRQKLAKYQSELEKRAIPESTFVSKLAKKDQDILALMTELQDLKSQVHPDVEDTKRKLLDPTWALLYKAMKKEVAEKNKKIEHLQREILGVGFTPYSITGKKIASKLRALQTENEELGKQLCQGRVEQLQTALALEKTKVEKLERSIRESNEMMLDLDKENEELSATAFAFEAKLRHYEPVDKTDPGFQIAAQSPFRPASGAISDTTK
ncbi:hypothetical protein PhCBS80983_g03342 [Powellomyces hirtus]|uniref:Uncharacterized protein n=1 Tax=Powellomyces hirtus TaxID=109895 RepID=A0A507E4R7_9FUNG|nr:hypothetical protein PhCBS80983_g03342 [Powellomyces hirtus]